MSCNRKIPSTNHADVFGCLSSLFYPNTRIHIFHPHRRPALIFPPGAVIFFSSRGLLVVYRSINRELRHSHREFYPLVKLKFKILLDDRNRRTDPTGRSFLSHFVSPFLFFSFFPASSVDRK